jgi:hypothetical protein
MKIWGGEVGARPTDKLEAHDHNEKSRYQSQSYPEWISQNLVAVGPMTFCHWHVGPTPSGPRLSETQRQSWTRQGIPVRRTPPHPAALQQKFAYRSRSCEKIRPWTRQLWHEPCRHNIEDSSSWGSISKASMVSEAAPCRGRAWTATSASPNKKRLATQRERERERERERRGRKMGKKITLPSSPSPARACPLDFTLEKSCSTSLLSKPHTWPWRPLALPIKFSSRRFPHGWFPSPRRNLGVYKSGSAPLESSWRCRSLPAPPSFSLCWEMTDTPPQMRVMNSHRSMRKLKKKYHLIYIAEGGGIKR